ncbi:glycosyl transferase, partial [Spirillospora sp. NPDC049652]
ARGGMPGGGPLNGTPPGFGGQPGPGPAGGGITGALGRGMRGGPGGLLGAATPPTALVAALTQDARSYTWAAAAVGSNNAAGYQLATGRPVMAVGGFNGTDPAPTLTAFQQLVSAKRIHYFIGGSMLGMRGSSSGGSDEAQRIAAWVQGNFTERTIGGVTVYDLSAGR